MIDRQQAKIKISNSTPPRSDSEQNTSTMPKTLAEGTGDPKKITSVPQYLGDLPDDSTIPFSIRIPANQIIPGTYPGTFKIVYADDLKHFHEVVIDGQVEFDPQQNNPANSGRFNQGSNNDVPVFVYPIIAVVAGIITIVVFRKIKSRSNSKTNYNDDDIESILDSTPASKDSS